MFNFLTLIGLVCLATVLYFIWMYKKLNSNRLPGPPIYPIIGSLPEIAKHKTDWLEWIPSTRKDYGEEWVFRPLNANIIITFRPETVEYFLVKNFSNYYRGSNIPRFLELFGTDGGIFTSNGKHWKSIRGTAKPLFRGKALRPMLNIFLTRAKTLCEVLNEKMDSGELLDIQDLFYRYTLDSIGEIGFGVNIDSLKKPVDFSHAFDKSQVIVEYNARLPWRRWFSDKKFDECIKILNDFVFNIMSERRKESEEVLKTKTDLLSQYLLMRDENGKPFSDKYMRDMLINFFIAGRDTTATLLSWTFYMLSEHPEVEKKLVQEIDDVLKGCDPDSVNIDKLPYMQAVLDETLRLYPPVPQDGRRAANDDVLPTGARVKKGDIVVYSTWVIHRHPEFWDEPEEFKPERWLEGNPLKHKYQYIPFHAGPQLCLGMKMAFIEAKAAISVILQSYHLRKDPACQVIPRKAIVLKMQNGCHCKVIPSSISAKPHLAVE